MIKRVLGIGAALLVALGAGWVWGASATRSASRAAEALLNSLGRQADTKPLDISLAKIDEVQRMAGQLNQDADALAAEASNAINDVLNTTVKR